MITTVTTTRQGRANWKTGISETITETWTQIEGTVTSIDAPSDRPAVVTVDAGESTVTVTITSENAVNDEGTERGLPQPGEKVTILATALAEGQGSDYLAKGFRTTVHQA